MIQVRDQPSTTVSFDTYDTIVKQYLYGFEFISANKRIFSPPDLVEFSDTDIEQIYYFFDKINNEIRVNFLKSDFVLNHRFSQFDSYVRSKDKRFKMELQRILKGKKFADLFPDEDLQLTAADNARRAKARFRDIVLSNRWSYFVTFTFAFEEVDRYSVNECSLLLQKFCKNFFRRHRGYYVFVPERHEDGALHFHGFIYCDNISRLLHHKIDETNGDRLYRRGHPVFSLKDWQYGFSELESVDNLSYNKAIQYCASYIKPNNKVANRWYYSGGSLVRKPAVSFANLLPSERKSLLECGARVIDIPHSNIQILKKFIDVDFEV